MEDKNEIEYVFKSKPIKHPERSRLVKRIQKILGENTNATRFIVCTNSAKYLVNVEGNRILIW